MRTPYSIKKYLLLLLVTAAINAEAQDFPGRPVPPRLVNDYAGMLSESQINALENKLVAFSDSSTTQIAIVTIKDLHGYEIKDYGQRLGEKWGIGQKGLNNGILILVKPGNGNGRGEVAITTGYGLEGAVPDIACGQIVDNVIIPAFRNDKYYEGLDNAVDELMALARGDYPGDKYKAKKNDMGTLVPFIIFIVIIIIIFSARSSGGKNQKHISNKGLPLWLLMSMMNSGRSSHNGSWGGFSGGGGFGGGGGGGFGGFGGGSFGGGGASGSW